MKKQTPIPKSDISETDINGGPDNFELLTNSGETERRERIARFGRKPGLLGLLTDGGTSLFGRAWGERVSKFRSVQIFDCQ